MPSIFNLDDDVRSFLLRMTASAEGIDSAVAEFQRLITDLRAEVAAYKALRERLQGAVKGD